MSIDGVCSHFTGCISLFVTYSSVDNNSVHLHHHADKSKAKCLLEVIKCIIELRNKKLRRTKRTL